MQQKRRKEKATRRQASHQPCLHSLSHSHPSHHTYLLSPTSNHFTHEDLRRLTPSVCPFIVSCARERCANHPLHRTCAPTQFLHFFFSKIIFKLVGWWSLLTSAGCGGGCAAGPRAARPSLVVGIFRALAGMPSHGAASYDVPLVVELRGHVGTVAAGAMGVYKAEGQLYNGAPKYRLQHVYRNNSHVYLYFSSSQGCWCVFNVVCLRVSTHWMMK